MKKILLVAAVAALGAAAFTTAAVAADVGVSVSVGQPGFYGQIDIGNYPPPRVVYQQPILVERVAVERAPIYLRVPPGHAKHWSKHCREYNACGQRVLFVQNDWYNREYVPRYREQHRDHDNRDDHRGDDRRDDRRDGHDDNGHGKNGHGNKHH